ncbi:nucleotidyltransferase family protein [Salinispira pacifica]
MAATLVVLAAGIGSRFGGIKQIEAIDDAGHAIIDYSVFDAKRAGFDRVVFVIRKEIEEDFGRFASMRFTGIAVDTVCQEMADLPDGYSVPSDRKKPWGTGHAVLAARETVKEPFAVINADDYYGRNAYRVAFEFLSGRRLNDAVYAIIGYVLNETLSENGTVSRGICKANGSGELVDIREHTKIGREEGSIVSRLPGEEPVELTGEEIVSMNFFAFTPRVFSQLQDRFESFLSRSATDPKAEYYIPSAMKELIDQKRATLKVLESGSRWFGMTYREDLEDVVKRIEQMRREGVYPQKLWE